MPHQYGLNKSGLSKEEYEKRTSKEKGGYRSIGKQRGLRSQKKTKKRIPESFNLKSVKTEKDPIRRSLVKEAVTKSRQKTESFLSKRGVHKKRRVKPIPPINARELYLRPSLDPDRKKR